MTKSLSIPLVRISSSSIVEYSYPDATFERKELKAESLQNLDKKQTNGYMSLATRSKVKKMLSCWCDAIEVECTRIKGGRYFRNSKLTFVTLTLPSKQMHTDNEIKRQALNTFIVNCTRDNIFTNYFWRAEAQKNGNIHFHLLIDSYVEHSKLKYLWNRCIEQMGYIDAFERKHKHRTPNSTDIRGLKTINNVALYVIKYVTKSDGYRKIEGRIWGCSDSLRKLKPLVLDSCSEVEAFVDSVQLSNNAKVYKDDNFCVTMSSKILQKISNFPRLLTAYNKHYKQIFDYLYRDADYVEYSVCSAIERSLQDKKSDRKKAFVNNISIQSVIDFNLNNTSVWQ